MALKISVPLNLKIPLPRRLPRGLLEPILKPMWRGPKTAGTVLHDRIALHKSLFLCAGCVSRMDRRHLRRLQYEELRAFHGQGICDGCQWEMVGAMWMWQGSQHIQSQARQGFWDRVRARDRAIRERDKR